VTSWTLAVVACAACGDNVYVAPAIAPQIDGEWWDFASNPDLGPLTGAGGDQPVDFTVWKAADGSWNLWGCIRFTAVGGNSRLFFHWQSPTLTARTWTPIGISMEADASVGEVPGGLQAPYVFYDGGEYHLFYGAWESICSATSADGITFARVLDANGQCPLFSEGPSSNTRDPMVIRVGDHWQVAYTAFADDGTGSVYARTSSDLVHWGDSQVIAFGGIAGTGGSSGESPFIEYRPELGYYYLFRTHAYGMIPKTEVYQSSDPLVFGRDDDRYHVATLPVASPEIITDDDGETYIAGFTLETNGYRMAHVGWSAVR
jgi:hypothetical protein